MYITLIKTGLSDNLFSTKLLINQAITNRESARFVKNIIDLSVFRRWYFFVPILLHLAPILTLTLCTSYILEPSFLPAYLIFSSVFLINTLFSLNTILRIQTGIFYYLLNMMFLLGFWLKFSVQKMTSLNYREPIGSFVLNSDAEIRILWVIICGMLGFLLSQTCSLYLFQRNEIKKELKLTLPTKKALSFLLVFTFILTFVNLKYNILLLGLKPSIILPLKGNAVYFLVLTRGVIFLFFFYCFKSYSNRMIFWGALIASICSIGVLSRMVVLTYFSVLFIFILQNLSVWDFKKAVKNILSISCVFIIFSYLTVLLSTSLRNITYITPYTATPVESVTTPPTVSLKSLLPTQDIRVMTKYFNIKQEAQTYKELALGRWIGMEGVMAVDSYPNKSFSFLWDAIKEKSYHGNSFYTQISTPSAQIVPSTSQVISTSVPGPIAFFYYSGSKFFVGFAIFISTFFFSSLEQLAFKFFDKVRSVGIFISTFIVFDFFQFGISPLAFTRYFLFSFLSIAIFYYLAENKFKGIYAKK